MSNRAELATRKDLLTPSQPQTAMMQKLHSREEIGDAMVISPVRNLLYQVQIQTKFPATAAEGRIYMTYQGRRGFTVIGEDAVTGICGVQRRRLESGAYLP